MDKKGTVTTNKSIIDDLLTAEANLDLFDSISIADITDNVRLINAYYQSGAQNLGQFLKLGEGRISIRNYGKKSENLLRDCLRKFISDMLNSRKLNEETAMHEVKKADILMIDHKQLRSEIKKVQKIKKSNWELVRNDLLESTLGDLRISAVAAEIGLGWPMSPKSDLSNKKIRDFLDSSLSQILEMKGFGPKKLGIYLQCVVYLHERLVNGDNVDENFSLLNRVRQILKHGRLTDREETVLCLRFGIQEERKHTLAEIKNSFGVTRERVRQIESKALRKLRMSRYFEELPRLLSEKKELIWEQLSDGTRLRKQEWMEPLEDRLGFEYQIALEICDVSGNRNTNTSVLANWLDSHFPHDETYWYRIKQPLDFEEKNRDKASNELLEFIDQL